MEPETSAAAKGNDANEDQNVPDPSTGDKADQDQQILIEDRDIYWYKSTLALKHLQAAFVPVVETEIKSLQEKSQTDFGRQLCKEATAEDIIRTSPNMAQFRHDCPGTLVFCQSLLNIIKGHTTDSVKFFEMLQGTDPQNWLKSPFEFVRLFLKDKMKFKVKDFQDCDITALCSIIKRCKPLMQMFGSKFDAVRDARNTTFHCSIMNISKQEMEDIVDVILDFLQQIKSLKNTDEVTEAIERIKQVKLGDIRLSLRKEAIQEWLPNARMELEHTLDVANNLQENITYVENEWTRLSPEVAASKSKGEEPKFEEKTLTEKQPDETRMWKQKYEDLVKLLQDEKQFEELRKRLSSSVTAIASTSFDRMHTPEVGKKSREESSSSDDSSDNSDSSSGLSQPKKFKPSVTGSTENMAADQFLQAVEYCRLTNEKCLKKLEKCNSQLAEQCQNRDNVSISSVTRRKKILMKIKKRKEENEKNFEDLKQNIKSIPVEETEPANDFRNTKQIKVCSLNVNGLKGRFEKTRKFIEFIKEHDIACFTETNLHDNDVLKDVEVDGYTFHRNKRPVTKRRSRGIGIYVKDTIQVVEEIDGKCQHVLWLKIQNVFEPLKETVVLGAVYIPYVGTRKEYANIMEELEPEVKSKRSEYKNVILAGDFNCYSGTLEDYTVNDSSADWFIKTCKLFKRLSIPLDRSSQDDHKNTAKGTELIELCKREQMFILNGRLYSDKGKGEITCTQRKRCKGSVLDYVIATETCLELFKSFKVKDVTTYEWFSDCHNALIFELGCNTLQFK